MNIQSALLHPCQEHRLADCTLISLIKTKGIDDIGIVQIKFVYFVID